jgi:alanine-glyoxylate transaminase/serine-glyoxylate transaminase/serine-pyruvate transaminase
MEQSNAPAVKRGRQFLHTPGPSIIPDRIFRAMDRPALDHRGPEFLSLARRCFDGLKTVFCTENPVTMFPAAGHGAWEAALANTLSPGDRIVMPETGAFSTWWKDMAESLGITVDYLAGDWRHGADPAAIEAHLADDRAGAIKAVALVHNETSTGILSDAAGVRAAIDRAGHSALYLVDTISSLASMDFRMDEWDVDVAVGGSQKGLMLPPGMSFTAIGPKALAAAKTSRMPRNYFDWAHVLPDGKTPELPWTPPEPLIFGLAEALTMLEEEGLETCFARHARLAEATRRAVAGWGFALNPLDPAEASNSVTAVHVPEGHDADAFRTACLDRYNLVLATGIGPLKGRIFRIGHLGDLNEAMILGTLATIETTLAATGVPHKSGGINAAIAYLSGGE